MKPSIQNYMDDRISEIRSQNTMFDIAVTTLEEIFSTTMSQDFPTQYSLNTGKWNMIVNLNESLYDGLTNVSFNLIRTEGQARVANMSITSAGVINESYTNVATVADRSEIYNTFSEIFKNVKNTIDNKVSSEGETDGT